MMFAQFYVQRFPIIYIQIDSRYFTDESFEDYKNSFLQILRRSKDESQKIIVILDLFPCDDTTFQMENVMKQVTFYKNIIHISQIYVQHVYILSHRTDLSILIKIFQSVGRTVVPYKVVQTIRKIEENIRKKYGEVIDLALFQNPGDLSLTTRYLYQAGEPIEVPL